jgi:hypothetical protein
MKLEGTDGMAADEKSKKLAEIDQKIAEIRSYTELIHKFN